MYKIALIGAGQLGSRHLQALAKINLEISIEVVEPNTQASEVAKQRFNEIGEKWLNTLFHQRNNKFFHSLNFSTFL